MNDLEITDLQMAQYLANKFDLPDLPDFIKRKLTIQEILKKAKEEKDAINYISIEPGRRRRI